MQRQPELHVSALAPNEFRAYTRYLDLIALTASREGGAGGLDADGTVRFERGVVREFCVERLGVPRGIVEDVLTTLLPATPRFTAGNVYAVLRLLAHIVPTSGGKSPRVRALDADMVFVPVDPLPLDPDAPLPLAPPRRAPSVHRSSRSISGPAILAPKPSLPPRRSNSPPPTLLGTSSAPGSGPPSPPARRTTLRKSLPAGHSLDPFRDTPSPTTSPSKTRTLSSSAAVGSNNPFRMQSAPPVPDISSPGAPSSSSSSSSATATYPTKVGPPLPPRKPSVRRAVSGTSAPGPALPPRQPSITTTRKRGDSVSSNDTSRQPTSIAQPSNIMQQSFAAAAAGELSRRKEDPTIQVIHSSPAVPAASDRPAPVPGRRDIIDTVTRAVRESELDSPAPPPRPPQRAVSLSSKPKPPRPISAASLGVSSAFHSAAEQYRAKYPGLKTWSAVALLAERPQRGAYATIILNQPITRKDALLRAWAASTLRFCADGGANRLYDALNPEERAFMLPTMIKGDLDSIRPEVRAYYVSKGVAIKRDPSEYATDLMKCIEEVESIESASGKRFTLLLLGGLSGRLDQTVHTMSIMFKLRTKRRDTFVMSEDSLAWVLDTGTHLVEIDHSTMGQTCGILPLGISEAFVRTEGLKWNLDWVTSLGGDVSTSNHLLPSEPAVFLETSAPVFWTVEIRENLPLPAIRSPLSPADELSRGVKELGAGFVRAAGGVAGVGKGLSNKFSRPTTNGDTKDGDKDRDGRDWDREKEREKLRAQQRETTGLVSAASAAARVDSEDERGEYTDGYALLD